MGLLSILAEVLPNKKDIEIRLQDMFFGKGPLLCKRIAYYTWM